MQPIQNQDLADVIGDLLKARQDCDVSFTVRIEVTGKQTPSDTAVQELNRVLKGVSDDLKIR